MTVSLVCYECEELFNYLIPDDDFSAGPVGSVAIEFNAVCPNKHDKHYVLKNDVKY